MFYLIPPEEKTMAFGGVETGSINALLAVSVTPRARYSGFTLTIIRRLFYAIGRGCSRRASMTPAK